MLLCTKSIQKRYFNHILQSFVKRYSLLDTRKSMDRFTRSCNNQPHLDDIKADARAIFRKAVEAVNPRLLVRKTLKVQDNVLDVKGKRYILNKNCYVVGFGKAILGMACEVEHCLRDNLVSGIISVPVGIQETFRGNLDMRLKEGSRIRVLEGAKNNMPDENSLAAAKEIEELVKKLTQDDLLIVLVSGGGSALLPSPVHPVTLEEKTQVIRLLASAGADITQLNSVRKKLSTLKGGNLARLAFPAKVTAFILSDIIDDPIDFISSGPTVQNGDPPKLALDIIKKFSLENKIPKCVLEHLENLERVSKEEIDRDNSWFQQVDNILIGNNSIALEGAFAEATCKNYIVCKLSASIEGEVSDIAEFYSLLTVDCCKALCGELTPEKFNNSLTNLGSKYKINILDSGAILEAVFSGEKRLCLLGGGETTVFVKGTGVGGRNQELALLFAANMHSHLENNPSLREFKTCLLSGGTDGIDGPTDVAGAVGYPEMIDRAIERKVDFEVSLENNDSYNFFMRVNHGEDFVRTGHTGTNVMDIHALIIRKVS